MQQNRDQQNPAKENNPETLAINDEKQRSQDQTETTNKTPTGNERNEKTDTDGSKAGMGE